MNYQATIIFLSGAAVGALVASMVLKDKYKNKYQKEADEKVASMQEYVDKMRELNKQEMLLEEEARELKEVTESKESSDKSTLSNYAGAYSAGAFMSEAIENYKKYKSQFEEEKAENESPQDDEPEDDIQESWDETQKREIEKKRRNDPPEQIEAFEYDDIPWHNKVTLVYYTEDEMLVNELDNEPVDDIEQLCGNVLEVSGFTSDDRRQEIYVRNWARGEDYDIYKCYGAFYE